jgi:hypothetical protein
MILRKRFPKPRLTLDTPYTWVFSNKLHILNGNNTNNNTSIYRYLPPFTEALSLVKNWKFRLVSSGTVRLETRQ